MVRLCLDLNGRLIEFQAIPMSELQQESPPTLDWRRIFDEAKLEQMRETTEVPLDWAPPVFVDARFVWRGVYADSRIPARAEAGLRNGRLVFFHAAPDQGQTDDFALFSESQTNGLPVSWRRTAFGLLAVSLLSVNLVLACHNVRLGRANYRGTAVLGASFFTAFVLVWLFSAHHVPDYLIERRMLAAELGSAVLWTVHYCMYYLALEPFVRRRWPWRMVAWNRMLAGRWRDPLVGRDVLLGAAAGTAVFAINLLGDFMPQWIGRPAEQPWPAISLFLTAGPASGLPCVFAIAIRQSLLAFVEFFAFYLLTRREWLAAIACTAFWLTLEIMASKSDENLGLLLIVGSVLFIIQLVVIMRFGVLALAALWISKILLYAPVTFDTSAWYSGSSLVYLGMLVGLVVYGFVVASGGQALAWVGHLTGEASAKVEAEVAVG
jgi:serine/threonine-protein kinase